MAFSGTQQKCKACDKIVHFVESFSADGVSYHKNCFRCSHCNGLLAISNYCSGDGILYCKVHYEQLFKETGSYPKRVNSSPKPPNELNRTPSKISAFFSGTQDKCSKCKKTVYPLEKLTVEGEFYHKSCFRCAHGGCFLTPSTYAALDGFLYCKPHFSQLFKEKGSYSYLSKQASLKRSEMLQQEAEAAAAAAAAAESKKAASNRSESESEAEAKAETETETAEAETEAETEKKEDEEEPNSDKDQ
ncbi:LIM domain-containing protein WLIM2a-like [Vigna unguiculata]|uniref:Cysteine and glycine-rich protein n=1 Tax=Vigna unguiculata TaxID=3917 RepID=A0A4D6L8Z3_VIGUN|nr:LIM domain-containing protein WLIM2a-like [Vigna unguiculata]QCD85018.1 cysteine and glycine-rich protein [Vigna unguiculata]